MIYDAKNILLPPFIEGIHYKELTPSEGKHKYRFVTLKKVSILFKHEFLFSKREEIHFKDHNGRTWMIISPYRVTIFKGYAWDGCTPKTSIMAVWVGTPDFPETILASLFHDAFRQFDCTPDFPIPREHEDAIFNYILQLYKFKYSFLYFLGVTIGAFVFPKNRKTPLKSLKIPLD